MAVSVPEDYVYLDWAATAPLCEEAAAAMAPFLQPGLGNVACGMNANSLHSPGRAAFEVMELARRSIARALGASRPNEIVFTSGATESCNAAIFGIARARGAALRKGNPNAKPRVIASAIEHDAVKKSVDKLKAEGFAVAYLKPDKRGFVSVEALEELLDDETVLVSVQMANSEIGSIQPIAELAKAAHAANALFHTDATQALGKMPLDVSSLGVDAASFSAHKIGGPKGVGALYLKARTPYQPLLQGGGQEEGRRSTTQNVCGIVGFAAALDAAIAQMDVESARQRALRDQIYDAISHLKGVRSTVLVDSGSTDYLPNIASMLVSGYESETLILQLDMRGFGVSGGSACSSHSLEPSHVLRALGVPADDAYGSLRVSIGRYTTQEDIARFVEALGACIG